MFIGDVWAHFDRHREEVERGVPRFSSKVAPHRTELSNKHFNDWVLAFRRGTPKANKRAQCAKRQSL
jgi:hypothetical protein